MLKSVDSDLYFVLDKDNYINPLLQVGSGSVSVEKSTGSGSSSLLANPKNCPDSSFAYPTLNPVDAPDCIQNKSPNISIRIA